MNSMLQQIDEFPYKSSFNVERSHVEDDNMVNAWFNVIGNDVEEEEENEIERRYIAKKREKYDCTQDGEYRANKRSRY